MPKGAAHTDICIPWDAYPFGKSKFEAVAIKNKNGDKRRVGTSLSELEAILPSYFIRINKSAIANENRIQMFNTVYSGAVDAVFKCGYKEYVSRRCFREIKRRLGVK